MQVAVIEFARNQLGHPEANSEEFNPKAKPPVIVFMPEVSCNPKRGGNSRKETKRVERGRGGSRRESA